MSATSELRRLLDERGVKWTPSVWSASGETFYKVGEVGYLATELSSERMKVRIEGYPTPAQAVEATLGRGTCRVESMHGYTDPFVETRYSVELSCHTLEDWPDSEPPAYCPRCGRKVIA